MVSHLDWLFRVPTLRCCDLQKLLDSYKFKEHVSTRLYVSLYIIEQALKSEETEDKNDGILDDIFGFLPFNIIDLVNAKRNGDVTTEDFATLSGYLKVILLEAEKLYCSRCTDKLKQKIILLKAYIEILADDIVFTEDKDPEYRAAIDEEVKQIKIILEQQHTTSNPKIINLSDY